MAYKARPANGELLFLAERDSVFGVLGLPTLRCWTGERPDRLAYLWQEWVDPPSEWGTLRSSPELRLAGAVLSPTQARRYFRSAGGVSAACFGFGIGDLFEGNVLIGADHRMYPVDLEVFLTPVGRLSDTGLIAVPSGNHHVGLENQARWCAAEGPSHAFVDGRRIDRLNAPWARTQTRTVVADVDGNIGYGPYLPVFLRGMFDTWVRMCRSRERLAELIQDRADELHVRVLLADTATYGKALAGEVPLDGFSPAERAQLTRADVPYFFRCLAGGPLMMVGQDGEFVEVADGEEHVVGFDPDRLTLSGLGMALRDAVEYAGVSEDDVIDDREFGVHVGPTEVEFDWAQTGKRVRWFWDEATVHLRIDPLEHGFDDPVRRTLMRIDSWDARLRTRWARDGFVDDDAARQLAAHTAQAMVWLEEVIGQQGWPGHAMVGPDAAEAACRLVQHAEGQQTFREHCLDLVRSARRPVICRPVRSPTSPTRSAYRPGSRRFMAPSSGSSTASWDPILLSLPSG